jgi:hemolysin III
MAPQADTVDDMSDPNHLRYTVSEEVANSVTHGIGWVLSVFGIAYLVNRAAATGGTLRIVSCAVFGITLVALYASSTLYHALPAERPKRVFRVLDHSAIFLLIAGTYTPLSLVALGGGWGWSLFGSIWFLATIGILLNTIAHGRWRWLSITLYVTMGWLVVVAIKPVAAALDNRSLMLLIAGGLAYTIGLAAYASKRLPYAHAVWHVFVLAGSVLHYFAVLGSVAVPG